jgi:hypothetical protein
MRGFNRRFLSFLRLLVSGYILRSGHVEAEQRNTPASRPVRVSFSADFLNRGCEQRFIETRLDALKESNASVTAAPSATAAGQSLPEGGHESQGVPAWGYALTSSTEAGS